MSGSTRRTALAVLLAAWALLILSLTLGAVWKPQGSDIVGFWCLPCGARGTSDAILNWLAFLPGGVLAALLLGRRWAVILALAVSGGLECAQWFIPGRYPTLADVVFNATGALAGAQLIHATSWHRARRLGAVVAAVAWIAPALLVVPLRPGNALWGQWTQELEGMARFGGAVLDARVGGLSVPSWRFPGPELAQALGDREDVDLTLRVGPLVEGRAPVFTVADSTTRHVLFLGAVGPDLLFHVYTVATVLRLEQPPQWLPGALSGSMVGDTIRVRLRRTAETTCMTAAEVTDCRVAPGLERGWQLLSGSLHPLGRGTTALSWLWCLGLGVMMGIGAGSRRRALAAAAAVGVTGWVLAWWSPDVRSGPAWVLLLLVGAWPGVTVGALLTAWLAPTPRGGEAPGGPGAGGPPAPSGTG